MDLAQYIRNVPDFPIEGIQFKDITTLLQDPIAFSSSVEMLLEHYGDEEIDVVVAIEVEDFAIRSQPSSRTGRASRKPGKVVQIDVAVAVEIDEPCRLGLRRPSRGSDKHECRDDASWKHIHARSKRTTSRESRAH